jgi:hypothetical protein
MDLCFRQVDEKPAFRRVAEKPTFPASDEEARYEGLISTRICGSALVGAIALPERQKQQDGQFHRDRRQLFSTLVRERRHGLQNTPTAVQALIV